MSEISFLLQCSTCLIKLFGAKVYYSSLAFGGRGSDSKVVVQLAHIATEDILKK